MARIRPPYQGGDGGGAVRFTLAADVATTGAPFFFRRREIGTSIAPAADRDNELSSDYGEPGRDAGGAPVSRYRVLVPAVAVAAGLLMTTASTTSRGTELRGQRDQLPELVVAEQERVAQLENRVQALRGEVEARTQAQSGDDARVAAATKD